MLFESEHAEIEIISPIEFMSRMGIKRTTFCKWKKSGKLIRGKHYIQADGVIRIFWSMKLLRELDDPPVLSGQPIQLTEEIGKSRPTKPKLHNGSVIDFSY